MRVRRGLSALICAALMLAAGCDNAEYRQQIAAFQQSIGNTRSAVESYYLEMNQFERDVYFLRLELDQKKKLGIKFLKDSRQREVTEDLVVDGPFSSQAIQARLDSISLLGLYGTRLAELAGTKAPVAFANNAAALGDNIVKLSGTFENLSGGGADPTAARYIGPIGRLIGIAGRLYLEHKRDKALTAEITAAAPVVAEIVQLLNDDFDEVIIPQRLTGMKGAIETLKVSYNNRLDDPNSSRQSRRALLTEIDTLVRNYELLVNARPQEVLQSLGRANAALQTYATSSHAPESLGQLVARMQEFSDRAKEVAAAIREIKDIRKELSRNEN
ncbi:MAG TPA: hypothetical protein VE715_19665 [Blastocatellia bacterium]|nr:hypothetical protein [Blastocatellia bacterium]